MFLGRAIPLAVEVKLEGTYQTPEQKAFQAAWEASGGLYVIVRSLDDAVEVFEAWSITRIDHSVSRFKTEEPA